MQSKRARLDRFLSERLLVKRSDVRLLLAQGRVKVDHQCASSITHLVDEYSHVQFDDQVLQAKTPSYIMLHKPQAVVSATKDVKHRTVIDLLPAPWPDNLHIVGRLDFNSTGLILLTNDGRWSRRLTMPESAIKKRYLVRLDKPVTSTVIDAFAQGLYFSFEDITTRPVSTSVINSHYVEVVLEEGRYHQIKRMFGHFQIKVLSLHRFAVGKLLLDDSLPEGQSRKLTDQEVMDIFN
ncbi:MAG: 16S rRNA pseudouridine516 synthase [Pseudohongiellaceae bacterium]|jgi:16S rRNA pseudouridine516 synthase